ADGQEVYVRNLAMVVDGRYHVVQVRGPEAERPAPGHRRRCHRWTALVPLFRRRCRSSGGRGTSSTGRRAASGAAGPTRA
ncbi:hypothetical protein ABT329_14575, partial [Streptomyces minutiscleroticus]